MVNNFKIKTQNPQKHPFLTILAPFWKSSLFCTKIMPASKYFMCNISHVQHFRTQAFTFYGIYILRHLHFTALTLHCIYTSLRCSMILQISLFIKVSRSSTLQGSKISSPQFLFKNITLPFLGIFI